MSDISDPASIRMAGMCVSGTAATVSQVCSAFLMSLILQSPSQDPAATNPYLLDRSEPLTQLLTGLIRSLTRGSISYTSQQHILLSLFVCACHKINTWENSGHVCVAVGIPWAALLTLDISCLSPLEIWSPCPTSLSGVQSSSVQFSSSVCSLFELP